ncbi:MAG: hypothetical protein HZC25_16870 [Rhodospirillales bacterium]|nr:hypothetical protein [Rhodospirillales bacterium]
MIELAIVLAVIGLLMGSGLLAIAPILENAKRKATNERLNKIEDALVLFVIRNNRLPCPANGSYASSNANYGLERYTSGTGVCTSASVSAANAVVPWRTLGLDETLSLDGWGRRISYHVADPTLLAAPAVGARTTLDSLVASTCMYRESSATSTSRNDTCDPPTTSIEPSYPYGNYIRVINASSVELTTDQPAATITTSNVGQAGGRAAYVLVSHGKNGAGAYGPNGTGPISGVPAAGTNESTNNKAANGEALFVQNDTINITGTSYFDDVVRWKTPAAIISACGTSACGNP